MCEIWSGLKKIVDKDYFRQLEIQRQQIIFNCNKSFLYLCCSRLCGEKHRCMFLL